MRSITSSLSKEISSSFDVGINIANINTSHDRVSLSSDGFDYVVDIYDSIVVIFCFRSENSAEIKRLMDEDGVDIIYKAQTRSDLVFSLIPYENLVNISFSMIKLNGLL